jgi:GMP synthase-like glutamine amidotransferase
MKIGILDVLTTRDLQDVSWQSSPAGTYIAFLESANAPFTYAVYDPRSGRLPAQLDECDAYLITGSLNGAYDEEPWIAALIDFIRRSHDAGKKMVGICFGHQLLAHALGGRSEKSEKGWGLGLKSFDIVEEKPWMNGRPDRCSLYFSHQDQVVQLPAGAERLGGSEFCENAFFVIGDHVLGIQGHPEFTTGIMRDLLNKPKETASSELMQTARHSLQDGRPDNELFAQWIVNFLNQQDVGC